MDCPQFIVSNQNEESIIMQGLNTAHMKMARITFQIAFYFCEIMSMKIGFTFTLGVLVDSNF